MLHNSHDHFIINGNETPRTSSLFCLYYVVWYEDDRKYRKLVLDFKDNFRKYSCAIKCPIALLLIKAFALLADHDFSFVANMNSYLVRQLGQ